MAYALRLFSINLYNTYYQAKVCDDFALVPTEESQRWMQRYRMKLVSSPGCFEVLWVVAGLTYPLQTLKEKTDGKQLTFYLTLKNPYVMCFSALSIDKGKAYYFRNTGTSSRLHQEAYVSEADKIAIQGLASYPYKLASPLWGMLDIHLDELWQERNLTENKLPIGYTIHIKARETIWRYCIVDKNSRIESPMKVVLDNEDIYFRVKRVSSKAANTHVYESTKPLALIDKPERFFSLRSYDQDRPEDLGETVVEKLPLPAATSLRRGSKKQKVLYNDISVYV